MANNNIQNITVEKDIVGLDWDNQPIYTKKGFYKYARNISTTTDNFKNVLVNENQFKQCCDLNSYLDYPEYAHLQGLVYIENGWYFIVYNDFIKTKFFKVNIQTEKLEYIGFINENDYNRSCEVIKTVIDNDIIIYVFDFVKPLAINIDKIDEYYLDITTKELDFEKLTLDLEFEHPEFEYRIEDNGMLKPGVYQIAIRYKDEYKNETSFITVSEKIYVKKDYGVISKTYADYIDPSNLNINQNYGKKIILNIKHKSNRNNYKKYDLAILVADTIENFTKSYLMSDIDIEEDSVTISTVDNLANINVEEIRYNKVYFEDAKTAELYDNRLVLGNIKYRSKEFLDSLQMIASKIKPSLKKELIELSEYQKGRIGLIPGEVYALGIVFIFEDGSVSDVYHIPGPDVDGENGLLTYKLDSTYGDNYYTDYAGRTLEGTNIRLVKIPYRTKDDFVFEKELIRPVFYLTYRPDYDTNLYDNVQSIRVIYDINGTQYTIDTTEFKYSYKAVEVIPPDPNDPPYTVYDQYWTVEIEEMENTTVTLVDILFDFGDGNGYVQPDSVLQDINKIYEGVTYKTRIVRYTYKYGINLDNINVYYSNIKGYYIVIDKKNDNTSNISDAGYITSLIFDVNTNKTLFSFLANKNAERAISSLYYGFIGTNSLYKKTINGDTLRVLFKGTFTTEEQGTVTQEDVLDGSSSNGLFFGLVKIDSDGIDFRLDYAKRKFTPTEDINQTYTIKSSFFLPQTTNKELTENIINASYDSQIMVLEIANLEYNFSYCVIEKSWKVYSDLRNIIYEAVSSPTSKYTTSIDIYGYDNSFTDLKYASSTFYKFKSPQWRQLLETTSNIIGYQVKNIFDAGAGIASFFSGNYGAMFNNAVNVLKNNIGIGIETFSMIKQLIKNEDESENVEELVYSAVIGNSYDDVADDTMIYQAEIYEGLFVDGRINNLYRNKVYGVESFCDKNPKEYYKNKYLFQDYGRDYTDPATGSSNAAQRVLSLKPFPDSELYSINSCFIISDNGKLFLPYNYDEYEDNYKNRIIWSAANNKYVKATFKALDYIDLDTKEIIKLKELNGKLFVFTDNNILFFPKPYQEKKLDDINIYVGTGQFLSVGPFPISDDDISSLSLYNREGIVKLKNSFVFAGNNGFHYHFSQQFKNLSEINMFKYFVNYKHFEFLKQWQDKYGDTPYPIGLYSKYGIGYIIGYDVYNNRVLITQKDFVILDENGNITSDWYYDEEYNSIEYSSTYTKKDIGYTLSFSFNTGTWISFHDYKPDAYLWDYSKFGYIKDGIIYLIDEENYNQDFEFELILTDDRLINRIWETIRLGFIIYDNNTIVYDRFFENAIFYNSDQISTLMRNIVRREDNTFLLQAINEANDEVNVFNEENYWNINKIKSHKNQGEIITEDIDKNRKRVLLYGSETDWRNISQLRDKFLGVRFINSANNTTSTTKFIIDLLMKQTTKSIS